MERQISIEVIGQESIMIDYDSRVSFWDLLKRFQKGQEILGQLGKCHIIENDPAPWLEEGIISAPRYITTFRIGDCLIDNRLLPVSVFENQVIQVFIIGGPKEEVKNLRFNIDIQVPRIFPGLGSYQDAGRWDQSHQFTVDEYFNIANFSTAEDILKKLSEKTNHEKRV